MSASPFVLIDAGHRAIWNWPTTGHERAITSPGSRCTAGSQTQTPNTRRKYRSAFSSAATPLSAVIAGSHSPAVPRTPCGTMDGLIHPFLQCPVELLGFGCEDQHVAIGQPDILGPGRRGDGCAERAIRSSQRHARCRQDFGVPTSRNQRSEFRPASISRPRCRLLLRRRRSRIGGHLVWTIPLAPPSHPPPRFLGRPLPRGYVAPRPDTWVRE